MQDQLLQTQILGVFEKSVNTKNGPKIIYEVQVEGGHTYSTFIKEIADEARAAVFQNVTMAVQVKQNGEWINRYLQKIIATAPVNGPATVQAAPTAPEPAQQASSQVVTGHSLTGPQNGLSIPQADDFEKRKQEQIHRQVACKVASNLMQPGDSYVDFWQNVDSLIQFFAEGVKPLAIAMQLDPA